LPSDAHDTTDPGPPERIGSPVGCTSGSVSSLTALNVSSAIVNSPSSTTPLSTPTVTATATNAASTRAVVAGIHRLRNVPARRVAARRARASPISPAARAAATSTSTSTPARAGGAIPISRWISRCQPLPRYRKPATATPPTPPSHRHATGPGAGSGRRDSLPHSHTASTPRPYPVAVSSPLIKPCSTWPRGSSDGVSDRQKKVSAPITPTKLYRHHRRTTRSRSDRVQVAIVVPHPPQ
jgi:hypothetical protein